MQSQYTNESDYCFNCGTPLLSANTPCPKCNLNSLNQSQNYTIPGNNKDSIDNLVCTKENVYFYISLAFSIITYFILIITIIPILYIMIFGILFFIEHGLLIGYIRGNAIKVTENQFPEVYKKTQELSGKIGLYKIPDVYILQQGGLLNAFATHFASRNFAVIYSDILELAYEEGDSALDFIICHELAHLKRKHIQKNIWLLPSRCIPFLGQAYSRACEYTCDRISAFLNPEGAINGLLVLSAGKKLYKKVNINEFISQANIQSGFWSWFSEIISSHPHLYKRLEKVIPIANSVKM